MLDAITSTVTNTQNNLSAIKTEKAVNKINNANSDELKAEAAAKQFEAVFLTQMLTPMFEGLETGGMFGGGHAEQIYRSMLIDEYGKMLAGSGAINVADAVKAQIIELQAKQNLTMGELQNVE